MEGFGPLFLLHCLSLSFVKGCIVIVQIFFYFDFLKICYLYLLFNMGLDRQSNPVLNKYI